MAIMLPSVVTVGFCAAQLYGCKDGGKPLATRQTTSRFFSRGPTGSLSGNGLEVSHRKEPLAQYSSVVRRTVEGRKRGGACATMHRPLLPARMPPARSESGQTGGLLCVPRNLITRGRLSRYP